MLFSGNEYRVGSQPSESLTRSLSGRCAYLLFIFLKETHRVHSVPTTIYSSQPSRLLHMLQIFENKDNKKHGALSDERMVVRDRILTRFHALKNLLLSSSCILSCTCPCKIFGSSRICPPLHCPLSPPANQSFSIMFMVLDCKTAIEHQSSFIISRSYSRYFSVETTFSITTLCLSLIPT